MHDPSTPIWDKLIKTQLFDRDIDTTGSYGLTKGIASPVR